MANGGLVHRGGGEEEEAGKRHVQSGWGGECVNALARAWRGGTATEGKREEEECTVRRRKRAAVWGIEEEGVWREAAKEDVVVVTTAF